MLNAFYDAVKGVNPANRVITAGTAPFGDPGTSGNRMRPARFDRELFCVSGAACSNPARFDVLSHHPYSVGGPNRKVLNADDVSVPDLGKLVTPLRRAAPSARGASAAPGGTPSGSRRSRRTARRPTLSASRRSSRRAGSRSRSTSCGAAASTR